MRVIRNTDTFTMQGKSDTTRLTTVTSVKQVAKARNRKM